MNTPCNAFIYGFDGLENTIIDLEKQGVIKISEWLKFDKKYATLIAPDLYWNAHKYCPKKKIPIDYYQEFSKKYFQMIAAQVARLDSYTGCHTRYDSILYKFYDLCVVAYDIINNNNFDICIRINIPHECLDTVFYFMAHDKGIPSLSLLEFSYQEGKFFIIEDLQQEYGVFKNSILKDKIDFSKFGFDTKSLYKHGNSVLLQKYKNILLSKKDFLCNIRLLLQYQLNLKKYSKPLNQYIGKKFAYFPLHYQPEASTCMFAPVEVENQLLCIREIAQKLPNDYLLLVKENPAQTHYYRQKEFFEELSQLTNVILIKRHESSRDIIEKCAFVATLTGTAGWEALYRGKPVVYFGYPLYRFIHGAFAYKNDLDLKTVIDYHIEHERVLHESSLLYSQAYDGFLENDNSEKNSKALSGAIFHYINENIL